MPWYDSLIAKGWIPDCVLRAAMRRLNAKTLGYYESLPVEDWQQRFMCLIGELRKSSVAVNTAQANQQHYEWPSAFFQHVLGNRLKYSSCFWDETTETLDQAEEKMLAITVNRAGIKNGQRLLDLGCGWGSLSLYIAEKLPDCKITALSNSKTQKQYIDDTSLAAGFSNITVKTMDINDIATFQPKEPFDCIISIEMFEHIRNYEVLLHELNRLLVDHGSLFVHIFTHKEFCYLFENESDDDWIGRYFFTGGIMPSDHLLLNFSKDFHIEQHWRVNGMHYYRTCNEWLKKMDQSHEKIFRMFVQSFGAKEGKKFFHYWRVFFMACAELFGYKSGNEWMVSHYLFKKNHTNLQEYFK